MGKIPRSRKWLPTPVFLPGEFHEQKNLVGYSPWGRKRVGCNWATKHKQQNINWMVEVSILSWEDYPGLSRWAQCNQRVFKSVRKEQKTVSEKEMWQQKQGRRRAVLQALKMEEGCQEPRNVGSLLKLQETRRWTLFEKDPAPATVWFWPSKTKSGLVHYKTVK